MRHFSQLDDTRLRSLFHRAPIEFDRASEPDVLAAALGATLYAPATRTTLAADIDKQYRNGVTSMVIDLEDAVADTDVAFGERNLVAQLREHALAGAEGPLVFVRVREPRQVVALASQLGDAAHVLTGFVLPKFGGANGPSYMAAVAQASELTSSRMLAMPVLESPAIIYRESRRTALMAAADVISSWRSQVLAVRIGATDLCSAFGLRRPRDVSIYDIGVVAEVIADIVNTFGRSDGTGFTISGPVYEYFTSARLFAPQLRTTPFAEHQALDFRSELIRRNLDGLIREVVLDQANGLSGKTVIHPTHVPLVHALSVVTTEQHSDATDILADDAAAGGVRRSDYANKMNEVKPHRAWAVKILRRADAFGVIADGVDFVDVLEACVPAADQILQEDVQ